MLLIKVIDLTLPLNIDNSDLIVIILNNIVFRFENGHQKFHAEVNPPHGPSEHFSQLPSA
jgi:hypothetical protein